MDVVKKKAKRTSRPDRWADACTAVIGVLSKMDELKGQLEDAVSELRGVQEEYEEWKDNMSDKFANSATGEKLEEVCNLEIEGLAEAVGEAIDSAREKAEEAEAIDLPRGFGRD